MIKILALFALVAVSAAYELAAPLDAKVATEKLMNEAVNGKRIHKAMQSISSMKGKC